MARTRLRTGVKEEQGMGMKREYSLSQFLVQLFRLGLAHEKSNQKTERVKSDAIKGTTEGGHIRRGNFAAAAPPQAPAKMAKTMNEDQKRGHRFQVGWKQVCILKRCGMISKRDGGARCIIQ